jgi:hypothetical protein
MIIGIEAMELWILEFRIIRVAGFIMRDVIMGDLQPFRLIITLQFLF